MLLMAGGDGDWGDDSWGGMEGAKGVEGRRHRRRVEESIIEFAGVGVLTLKKIIIYFLTNFIVVIRVEFHHHCHHAVLIKVRRLVLIPKVSTRVFEMSFRTVVHEDVTSVHLVFREIVGVALFSV